MSNYSWLQENLHKFLLSSKFMRKVTYDFENLFFSSLKEIDNIDNHVFVAGLARSGTTILLNAIHKTGFFSSLSYQDMPFILAPNLGSKISFNKKNTNLIERAHGDGIKISVKSPEAFEEVFWKTFDERKNNSKINFKNYVELINRRYKKKRYLSKNNQNIKRIELILQIFPNSKVLIPFRNPVQQAYSLLNQHKKFIELAKTDSFISDYMKLIGHTEFGPNYFPIYRQNLNYKDDLNINHWIEQWYFVYGNYMETLKNNKNVNFICYEKLCKSTDYWRNILRLLNIDRFYNFNFKESKKDIPISFNDDLIYKSNLIYNQLIKSN